LPPRIAAKSDTPKPKSVDAKIVTAIPPEEFLAKRVSNFGDKYPAKVPTLLIAQPQQI
jgi:hypothetical protein